MTTVMRFLVEWKESNLLWVGMDTFVYSVILDADMRWTPHIKLGNPHASQRVMADTNDKVILEYEGQVTWSFVWTVDTRYKIDITYYPFDRQYYLIDLVLSSDLEDYLNFDHTVPHLALDNGNWKHINTSIYNYTNYNTMKTHIVIENTFDRKSVTPMLVFMAPETILVSLLPLVFVLPNDGSERLGIAVTVLLAVSVYMTLVVDKLPDSSDPLPLITTVFFAWLWRSVRLLSPSLFLLQEAKTDTQSTECPGILGTININRLLEKHKATNVRRRDLIQTFRKKRPNADLDCIILYLDISPAHRAASTQLEIAVLGFELLEYLFYSPDLAPMDFRTFPDING
ncbi:neuronal acetylcholine receptor subunit beta-3-like [Mya arenaria]|uniref:neuronal acetylcholine receptor subunit beta-3-like n=1 Tax=Mya arenaria TaxID=6604 RepID=UPI0022E208B7|nr:neuronal acetylcholine receptor subunit beta-3-like [Mya arenaria]